MDDENTQVLIVGGGLTGLSAAAFLAYPGGPEGLRVIVPAGPAFSSNGALDAGTSWARPLSWGPTTAATRRSVVPWRTVEVAEPEAAPTVAWTPSRDAKETRDVGT